MPYYTADHQRFVDQIKKGNLRSGQRLDRKAIIGIVQADNPSLQPTSFHPSDHDNIGNKGECGCRKFNDHIFKRVARNLYEVR